MRFPRLVLLAVWVALSPAWAAPAWHLSPEGYGPVTLGSNALQVTDYLRTNLGATRASNPPCVEMEPLKGYPGITFIFDNDALVSLTASYPSRATSDKGISIGAAEATVRRAYGDKLNETKVGGDSPPAKVLSYWAQPDRAIRFRIGEDRRVLSITVADRSIRVREGCL